MASAQTTGLSSSESFDLSAYKIPCPHADMEAFYIPSFVSTDEEDYLLRKIRESPQPKWKQLANRRLQTWGGEVTPKNTLIPQPFPSFVTAHPDIIRRIRDTGVFRRSKHGEPNHVIMNEYLPGQGIMPHEDGPAYHPVVATLSLASHAVFHYYQYRALPSESVSELTHAQGADADPANSSSRGRSIDPRPVLSIFLEPRSLVITRSSLYTHYLHGIEGLAEDHFQTWASPLSSEYTIDSETPSRTAGYDCTTSDGHAAPLANSALLSAETQRTLSDLAARVDLTSAGLERGTRYSLTCRDVEKVAGSLKGFGVRK